MLIQGPAIFTTQCRETLRKSAKRFSKNRRFNPICLVFNMSWHKFTFLQGERSSGRPLRLTELAQQRDKAAGGLPSFAVYITLDEEACPVVYFSPVASSACEDLITANNGVPCEAPSAEELLFSTPAYGSL